MWASGWRDPLWAELDQVEWDLIVIGGGITGAGILRESARLGLRCIMFEAHDFASGTSSRSSKLVHGGLRYLRNAQIKLTSESVHEREHLLKEGRGLVTPLPFLMATFPDDHVPHWLFGLGLSVYDLLALKWNHASYSAEGMRTLCPQLSAPQLVSGFRYFDAQTDDARLVLRVLQEAVDDGAAAMNYARVEGFLRDGKQKVCGVSLTDLAPEAGGRTVEVRGRVVINASGAWADELRNKNGGRQRLRILRGSHLFMPWHKLPLTRAVTFWHPQDGRPVFIFPWEGITLVGTTDVDHPAGPDTNLAISQAETDYLMSAVQFAFPDLGLKQTDVQSTLAGVRAVVNTGKANPSKESREFVLWLENGLLTVSGGKLTTFRLMAHKALKAVRPLLPERIKMDRNERVLDPLPDEASLCDLPVEMRLRLLGRYGRRTCDLGSATRPGEMETIAENLPLWAELRWAARAEGVLHLDDLLLRRVRLGLQLPGGGVDQLERIRAIVQPELGWSEARWQQEAQAYQSLWQTYYAPPG
jgi:glycerol-3-phosphate dehydrogenase